MAEKVKTPNYSPELEAKLVELYDAGKGLSIEAIAAQVNKPVKSVRSKLVSMKVYVKPEAPVKEYKAEGPSKKEIIEVLKNLGISETSLDGLKGATKPALSEVAERLKSAQAA
jgi:hypothetical protein